LDNVGTPATLDEAGGTALDGIEPDAEVELAAGVEPRPVHAESSVRTSSGSARRLGRMPIIFPDGAI
jgi:hypothetical protein